MQTVGIFIIAISAWLIYGGWKGFNPLTVAETILRNPADADKAIATGANAGQGQLQSAISAARGTASSTSGATSSGPVGQGVFAVVAFARAQVGKRYVLGGAGPDVWDCSGLVMKAYALVGITVPHSALAQSLRGTKITRKEDLVAGDLLFPTGLGVAAIGDHVQIYSGANTVIEAANPSTGVREIALSHWWPTDRVVARRYIAAG